MKNNTTDIQLKNGILSVDPKIAQTPGPIQAALGKLGEQHSDLDELRQALYAENKERLFDCLQAAGITAVRMKFDGYADSGQVEDVTAYSGAEEVDLPEDKITYAVMNQQEFRIWMTEDLVEYLLDSLSYDWLDEAHDSWAVDEGAFGEFCFDVSARSIELELNARFVATECYHYQF